MSLLLDFLQWCSTWAPIVFVRDSKYGMPGVQSVHLVGLTVLLAAMLMLDLRLAGVGMLEWSLHTLERQLRPWALAALALVMLSGALIFIATPAKYLASNPFRVKMAALALAIVFQAGLLRRFATAEPAAHTHRGHPFFAALSLTLWFLVGWAGRAIAFIP